MFDSNATFKLDFPLATGRTILTVRWPTDDEWSRRVFGRRLLIRSLGRGRTEYETEQDGKVDLQIFEAISQNGNPPVTPGEATMTLDQLSVCEVQNVELEGNRLRVALQVLGGGEITHVVDLPTADQILKFKRKQAKTVQLPHNLTESRQNLRASGELWSECHGAVEGQEGAPSVLHKDIAIREAISFMEQLVAPPTDDQNFK